MTGPEHYREAEQLEGQWGTCRSEQATCPHCVMAMARAQVHATLALAAATALRTVDGALPQPDYRAWHDAAAARQEVTR